VFLAQYGRGQESEADSMGMRLAARSGYNPGALSDILGRLEKNVQMITGKKQKFSFFDSHPTTPTRVKDLDRESAGIERSPRAALASGKKEFLGRLDGIFVTDNPAQGIFQGRQFLQPTMNIAVTFPDQWETVNTPSAAGAVQKDKEALVFLGIAGKSDDPEKQAKALVEQLKKEYKASPSSSRPVKIGAWPGYAVTYTDDSGREPMHMHFLWVAADKVTFQLIGVGSEKYREVLKQTALSLRPLTSGERSSITGIRLRITAAKPDETMAELGRRTGNAWPAPYAAVMNGTQEDKKLEAGELIKIAREEPYRPASK
jgi:predicted Zn-dependent protease